MMPQRTPGLRGSAWTAGAVCLWLCAAAAAQTPGPKVISWGTPPADGPRHYGILGEIVRPGVYASDQEATLQGLVESAGGLSDMASPSLRIIRSDRAGQTIYFSPQGRDPLLPGDVIVVDPLRLPSSGTLATGGVERPSGVWIGLLGVSSRPVIVRLAPQNAYLPTLMTMLRQSSQLARVARLILPQAAPGGFDLRGPLPNGTIVALPPSMLVQGNLPELPPAIPLATTTGSQLAQAPTAELGQLAPHSTAADWLSNQRLTVPPHNGVPAPQSDAALASSRAFDRELAANTLPYASTPLAFTDANPASLPAPGSRLAQSTTQPVIPMKSTPPNANLTAIEAAESNTDLADLVGEPAIEQRPATFSIWQMLGIGGTVASLVGIALGTRQYLDRQSLPTNPTSEFRRSSFQIRETQPLEPPAPELPSPPLPKPNPAVALSALLNNSLPLTTEPAELPRAARLQRATIADRPTATESAVWRTDPMHPAMESTPHFDVAEVQTAHPILELDEPQPAAVPRPHFRSTAKTEEPDNSPTEATPTAERPRTVLATSGRESGKTSVERALSQLQRGRRA